MRGTARAPLLLGSLLSASLTDVSQGGLTSTGSVVAKTTPNRPASLRGGRTPAHRHLLARLPFSGIQCGSRPLRSGRGRWRPHCQAFCPRDGRPEIAYGLTLFAVWPRLLGPALSWVPSPFLSTFRQPSRRISLTGSLASKISQGAVRSQTIQGTVSVLGPEGDSRSAVSPTLRRVSIRWAAPASPFPPSSNTAGSRPTSALVLASVVKFGVQLQSCIMSL